MNFDFFRNYDDKKKSYEVIFASGRKEQFTERELIDFFILREHGLNMTFDELLKVLDQKEVTAEDTEYDWNLGTYIYNGNCTIRKIVVQKAPSKVVNNGCDHKNKYIVQHFNNGVRYWVCPACKADLGDA